MAFLIIALVIALVVIALLASRKEAMPVTWGTGIRSAGHLVVAGSSLTVATYNIHSGKGESGKLSLDAIAQVLSDPPIDFAGLNEVRADLQKRKSQAEILAEKLGLGWIYAPTRKKFWYPHFGNAVLSRVAITGYRVEPLVFMYESDGVLLSRAHRNVVIVKLEMAGEEVAILVTHIDRGPLRLVQLADVLEKFKHYSRAVLMGDFNTPPDETVLREFLAAGHGVDAIGDADGIGEQERRIDWILTRGFDIEAVGTYPRGPSDHPQYWATLTLEHQ